MVIKKAKKNQSKGIVWVNFCLEVRVNDSSRSYKTEKKPTWKKSGIENGVQDPIYLTSNEFQSFFLKLHLFEKNCQN